MGNYRERTSLRRLWPWWPAMTGAPEWMGVEIEDVIREGEGEAGKTEAWLRELAQEIKSQQYRPSPVLRAHISKGEGKMRPLGIPTVKDRVVQAAAVLVLMPIFEADMHEHS